MGAMITRVCFSSWPGLSRPSTPFLCKRSQDVDARDKPGHDELCFARDGALAPPHHEGFHDENSAPSMIEKTTRRAVYHTLQHWFGR
jgi:hypothetical protein